MYKIQLIAFFVGYKKQQTNKKQAVLTRLASFFFGASAPRRFTSKLRSYAHFWSCSRNERAKVQNPPFVGRFFPNTPLCASTALVVR